MAVVVVVVVGTGGCGATNPYDPASPTNLQAKARIVGHLGGDVQQDPAVLTLVDGQGHAVVDANGHVQQFNTLAADAPVPAGLPAGAGKPFQIGDLVPGTYTVVFSASANSEPLLLDARSAPGILGPGDTAVLDLAPAQRDLSDVTGAVHGTVQGSEGGASFAVKLVAESGNPDLAQTLQLDADGDFTFRHVAAGSYRIEAAGDTYAPASTPFFQVADVDVGLDTPLVLTTLGRVFSIDDFVGHDGQPPFAPFLPSSPLHVAVAPLVFSDTTIVAFARVYTDDTRPGPDDGWQPLTGADDLDADYDTAAGDGPRTVLAQLRLCFSDCADPLQPPLVSREIPLDFVFDATPPRAVSLTVDDVVRNDFLDGTHDALVAAPAIVTINCAQFGDAECAAATLPSTSPAVAGDLVDDTSRVQGFFFTTDDTPPTQFTPLGTLGQLARIQGVAPALQKSGPASQLLFIWAQDAAGNVGLVDVRDLVVDVDGIDLGNPALTATAGTITRAGSTDLLVPGASVTVDVNAVGERPALWHIHNQGTASARGLVVDQTIPYTGPQQIDVDGTHLQTLALTVDAFDSAGNLTRTSVPLTLLLSRTTDLTGTLALENRADVAGASLALVDDTGTTVTTVTAGASSSLDVGNPDPLVATLNLDGSYVFAGVPVKNNGGVPSEVYTVVATGPAPFSDGRVAVTVAPPGPSIADPITLTLPRGSLVGRFVLEGRENALTNSGIQVTLVNSLGKNIESALTFADGTWRIDSVPVDTGYKVVGFFDGFIQQEIPGVEVRAGGEDSIVDDDGTGAPTAIVLDALSGDFRLCALGPVLDLTCNPIVFTNQAQLMVGGISFDGITAFRVSTTPFGEADAQPAFQNVVGTPNGSGGTDFDPPLVTLGPSDGAVTVFLQLQTQSGATGAVLHSGVVFDTTPPVGVTASIGRGAGALLDGFTNESVGRVTVHADQGGQNGTVSPLKEARVVFAAAPPSSVPAVTACAHDVPCAVAFDTNSEGTHTAFVFSCDQAGNCTQTPVSAAIAVDRTPPLATNGTSFVPKESYIVSSGGQLFTRSAQFRIAIETGHGNVHDVNNNVVADVFGTKFGLTQVVDDGTFAAIPAPAPAHDTERLVPGVALPPIDGTYTIFAQLTDAAGNSTPLNGNPFHVDLVLDTRGPTLTFDLNSGAVFTRNSTVTLDINDQSTDPTVDGQFNLTGVFLDNDPSTFDDRALPLQNTSFDLHAAAAPAGDGDYTVFARFFDRAGNLTERQASIFLDRTPPAVLLVDCASCADPIHSGPATTANPYFTNAATHQIVVDTLADDNSGAVASIRTTVRSGALTGVPQTLPFSGTQNVTLSVLNAGVPQSLDGAYSVDVVFIDQAGNETAPTTIPVVLDTAVPTPALAINGAIGASAPFSNSENVSLTVSGGASTSPIVGIRVQNTAATFVGLPQPLVPNLAWQLANPGVDESKLVFLEATDAAGNVGVVSQSITLDKTPPTGTVTIAAGAPRINSTIANVTYSYILADVAAFAVTTNSAGFPANCAGVAFTNGASFPAQVTFAATSGG
ncbi:MAG TPA: carboxypeptidase-like regulatory domain-containing protein, partial [Myxococcota bacterium]